MTRVTSPRQRQDLEVEHQPGVIGVGGRHADGPVQVRQGVVLRLGLGPLDPALDLADRLQILADPGPVRRAELRPQAGDLVGRHGIQEAGPLLRSAARRSAGVPPSPKRRSKTIRGCASEPAAASWGRTTRGCSDRRRHIHYRTGRRSRAGPSTFRATATASPDRSAWRRSGRPSSRGSNPCSRSDEPVPRSGRRRSRWHACRGTRSSAPGLRSP